MESTLQSVKGMNKVRVVQECDCTKCIRFGQTNGQNLGQHPAIPQTFLLMELKSYLDLDGMLETALLRKYMISIPEIVSITLSNHVQGVAPQLAVVTIVDRTTDCHGRQTARA